MTVERVVAGVVASLALVITAVACVRNWSWDWTEPWGWVVIVPLVLCLVWQRWRTRGDASSGR